MPHLRGIQYSSARARGCHRGLTRSCQSAPNAPPGHPEAVPSKRYGSPTNRPLSGAIATERSPHTMRNTSAWRGRAVAAASLVAALAVAACSSSGSSSTPASTSGSNSAANGISGQRFTLMLQSTANVSKVVEVHAVNILASEGVQTSVKWNASTPNVAISELTGGDIDAYSEAVTGGVSAV